MDKSAATEQKKMRLNRRDLLVALVGPVLVLALFGVYLVSPGRWVPGEELDGDRTLLLDDANKGFYLTYILEERYREYQLVEMLTLGCSAGAALLAFVTAGLMWRRRPRDGAAVHRLGPVAVVLMIGCGSLLLAGEEVNWGQTFARWGQPEIMADGSPAEAYEAQSLHNQEGGVPLQTLGPVAILVLLVVFPAWWHGRGLSGRFPPAWGPAVAAWPAGATALFAFALKEVKSVYRGVVGKDQAKLEAFYMGYLEQINEQKEMLLALALLIYAAYALARAWPRREAASA